MSFDSYANLQTEILSLLNRTDSEAAARCPSWVELAEGEMLRRFVGRQRQGLPIPRRLTGRDTASFAIAAEYVAGPDDFVGPVDLTLTDSAGNVIQLGYLDSRNLQALKAANRWTGAPKWYTVIDGQLRIYPAADQAYTAELVFIERPSPLSASNTSNWILEDHPDAYLYGSEYHGLIWLKASSADKAEALALFAGIIDDICNADPLPSDSSTLRTELSCLVNPWRGGRYSINSDS